MAYIRKCPEIAKWPKFRGNFGNLSFRGPTGANFEKCSTRKLFASEKQMQWKKNRPDRSLFEIFRAETINFTQIKISQIRDTETFRITKFPNLRNTIPNHSKNYFTILEHLFVQNRPISRLNFNSRIFQNYFKNPNITLNIDFLFFHQLQIN